MKDPTREVLKITELTTEFRIPEGVVPAVNQLSFNLHAGETVCLVGESGCGKSVTALSIMRLTVPSAIVISSNGTLWLGFFAR